ncbi:processed acidic surface protein [Bacillus sp. ISL-7]|uniref:processed acidic surface protein n=1 Tax=Bacillus sp. ISL-7 TaxID=2819136 RepID=UPI001BE9431D|nr:processed acidic surface protein [Bacillus sp. ISL-7]MBT2737879.1 processed acidic surface protein [Bacillus sp. ISL-7]
MGKIARIVITLVLLLGFLPKLSFAAENSDFDADLETYLKEISEIRGFTVTKDDIEMSLSYYDENLEDFKTVNGPDGLKEFLGEVIKSDYSNLAYMKDDYGLSIEQITSLLKENGEDLNDYVFVNDLDESVYYYSNPDDGGLGNELDPDSIKELLTMFQDEFGLTDQELTKLGDHLNGLKDKLSTPEALDQMEKLAQRMEAFQQFQTIDQLSPAQIQELMSIYQEFISMLEFKIDFILVKGDNETPLTLIDVLKMKELVNAKLKVTISDLEGNFLADLLVTGEMVDSDTVKQVGKDLSNTADKVKEVVKAKPIAKHVVKGKKPALHPVMKTVKGGELPNTAGNYVQNVLIGMLLILGGAGLYYSIRRRTA